MPKKHRKTETGKQDPLRVVRGDRLAAALTRVGLARREAARILRTSCHVAVTAATLDYLATGAQRRARESLLTGILRLLRARGMPTPRRWLTGEDSGLRFLPLNSLSFIDLDGTGSWTPNDPDGDRRLADFYPAADVELALDGLLTRVRERARTDFPPPAVTAIVAAVAELAVNLPLQLFRLGPFGAWRRPSQRPEPSAAWIDGIASLLNPWLEGREPLALPELAAHLPHLSPTHRERLLAASPQPTSHRQKRRTDAAGQRIAPSRPSASRRSS